MPSPPRISVTLVFQSTRPARGATALAIPPTTNIYVSIHAPRAGRDEGKPRAGFGSLRFNPRAPRGARLGNR